MNPKMYRSFKNNSYLTRVDSRYPMNYIDAPFYDYYFKIINSSYRRKDFVVNRQYYDDAVRYFRGLNRRNKNTYYAMKSYEILERPDFNLNDHYFPELSEVNYSKQHATSKKQIKHKRIIKENLCNLKEFPLPEERPEPEVRPMSRFSRFGLVMARLTKTGPAKDLAYGYLRVFARKQELVSPGFLDRFKEALSDPVKPQMEDAHGSNEGTRISKSGNVIIQDNTIPSVGKQTFKPSQGFLDHSSAIEAQTYEQIANRFLIIENDLRWKTSDVQGSELQSYNLPQFAFEKNINSPNILPFLIHRYGRFDMEVKVLVNANKFHVGQLQVSWMYNGHIAHDYSDFNNLVSSSQRLHALVSADVSNEASLSIPYWALTSLLDLKMDKTISAESKYQLNLGTLSIKVMNPLVAQTGVSQVANVTVMVSFLNIETRGLISRGLQDPYPQMMRQIVSSLDNAISIADKVFDLDNPNMVKNPITVQPSGSQTMCYVDKFPALINSLRGDPEAMTPACRVGDGFEAALSTQLFRWSYLNSFNWSTGDSSEKLLYSMNAEPLLPLKKYKTVKVENDVLYALPPLAVLSSLFGKWRGDIEVRLDIIATQFHSGRLALCTIPGANSDVVFANAKYSAMQINNIKNNHQITYKIPYYQKVPFVSTRSSLDSGEDFSPPSRFFIYVLNNLVTTASAPVTVPINIYIRAGENFEFSLLKTPTWGLTFNKVFLQPSSEITHVNRSWAAMFIAGSRWAEAGGFSYCSFFYNQTTDYFTQFDNLDWDKVYQVPDVKKKIKIGGSKYYFRVQFYDSNSVLHDATYFTRMAQYPSYPVVLLFDSLSNAQEYLKDKSVRRAVPYYKQGPWAEISDDGSKWTNIATDMLPMVDFIAVGAGDFEILPNMEEAVDSVVSTISLDQPAKITNFGRLIFGETVETVKAIGHRWQHYGCVQAKIPNEDTCIGNTAPFLKIQLHPIKHLDVKKSSERDNRLRDGPISIIASAFAGYRGSLRVRIVFSPNVEGHFTVVHRFNEGYDINTKNVTVLSPRIRASKDFFESNYASMLQVTNVNQILDFVVPYYRASEYCSLLRPIIGAKQISANFTSLGNVLVYLAKPLGPDVIKLNIDVFYSLDSDFVFSCFQGYPLMFPLSHIPPEPQPKIEPQMDYVTSSLKLCGRAAGIVGDNLTAGASKCLGVISEVQSLAGSMISKGVSVALKGASNAGAFAMFLISQIMHLCACPYRATVMVAAVSILAYLFSEHLDTFYSSLKDKLSDVCEWFYGIVPQQLTQGEPGIDTLPVQNLVSLLWSIIGSVLGIISLPIVSFTAFAKGLFSTVSTNTRSYVFGITFFKDLIILIKRLFVHINKLLGKKTSFYSMAPNEKDLLTWLTSVEVLTDELNKDKIVNDYIWQKKAFEAYARGKIYYLAATKSGETMTPALFRVVSDYKKKIDTLVLELKKARLFAPLRAVPVTIWLHGTPGLGKTKLSVSIVSAIAAQLNISPKIASITSGQNYYDLVYDQHFLLWDDFLSVGGINEENFLAQFQQIVSSTPISLPRSDVKDKKVQDSFDFLIVTSNQSTFQAVPSVRCQEAFDRRRDIIIEFGAPGEYDSSKANPRNRAHYNGVTFSVWNKLEATTKTFLDQEKELMAYIVEKSVAAYNEYQKEYVSAFESYSDGMEKCAENANSFNDYIEALKAVTHEIHFKKDKLYSDSNINGPLSKLFSNLLITPITEPNADVESASTSSFHEVLTPEEVVPEAPFDVAQMVEMAKLNQQKVDKIAADNAARLGVEEPVVEIDRSLLNACLYNQIVPTVVIPKSNDPYNKYSGCAHRRVQFNNCVFINSDTRGGIFLNTDPAKPVNYACYASACKNVECSWDNASYQDFSFQRYWDCVRSSINMDVTKLNNAHLKSIFPEVWLSTWFSKYYLNLITPKTALYSMTKVKLLMLKQLVYGAYPVDRININGQVHLCDHAAKPSFCEASNWRELLSSLAVWISVFVSLSSLFVLLYKSYKFMRDWFSPNSPQINTSGDNITHRGSRLHHIPPQPNLAESVLTEQKSEMQCRMDKIMRNQYFIYACDEEDNVKFKVRCLGLFGNVSVVLTHYLDFITQQLKDNPNLRLMMKRIHLDAAQLINFTDMKITRLDSGGYAVCEFPLNFSVPFKNILHYLPTKSVSYPSNIILVEAASKENALLHYLNAKYHSAALNVQSTNSMCAWEAKEYLEYSHAGLGICGSFVFAPSLPTPLIGIHTSGRSNHTGFAECLFRETFEPFKVNSVKDRIIPQMQLKDDGSYVEGSALHIGTLKKKEIPYSSTISKIVPSLLHDVITPHQTEPAPLHARDARLLETLDPFWVGCSKRAQPMKNFLVTDLALAKDDLLSKLKVNCVPTRATREKLTMEQVICGSFGIPYMDAIEMQSSEGYPWRLRRPRGCSGKSWLFNVDLEKKKLFSINSDLQQVLCVNDKLRKSGVVPEAYFTACLKDARIPLDKIPIPGKTRLFEMSPIQLTLAQRKLHLDFYSSYQNCRMDCENTIGINVNGPEWSNLARNLNNFSDKILAGDYSSYGPRANQIVVMCAWDIIFEWLIFHGFATEDDRLESDVMKIECLQAFLVARDLVFIPNSGLNSGNCGTVVLNSLINSLYIRMAYLDIMREMFAKMADLSFFSKFLKCYFNGDDLIIAVRSEIANYFNNVSLHLFFKKLDLNYTDCIKDRSIVPYRSLEDVTYLKCKFRKHPFRHQYVAVMDEISINDCYQWVWKSPIDIKTATIQNADQALRLAYGYGPNYYNSLKIKLENALHRSRIQTSFPSWCFLDRMVWDMDEDIWGYIKQ